MCWSIFSNKPDLVHRVKNSTVQREFNRRVGLTFCGQLTTETADYWVDETAGIKFCAVCYRAYLKTNGKRVDRKSKLGRRTTTVESWNS